MQNAYTVLREASEVIGDFDSSLLSLTFSVSEAIGTASMQLVDMSIPATVKLRLHVPQCLGTPIQVNQHPVLSFAKNHWAAWFCTGRGPYVYDLQLDAGPGYMAVKNVWSYHSLASLPGDEILMSLL